MLSWLLRLLWRRWDILWTMVQMLLCAYTWYQRYLTARWVAGSCGLTYYTPCLNIQADYF